MHKDLDPRYGGAGRGGIVENALVERPDNSPPPRPAQAARIGDPAYRRQVDRLHALGPRPLGELLVEIARNSSAPAVVADAIDRYADLDPGIVHQLGGDRWPAMPLHEVSA